MLNRENVLVNAGIATENMFSIQLPKGLKPGAKLTLMITDDEGNVIKDLGNLSFKMEEGDAVKEMDVEQAIVSDNWVNNRRLFRRFITAQTFRMLNYRGFYGTGYTAALNMYSYNYQFEYLKKELNVLRHLEKEDVNEFKFRTNFFDKAVVVVCLCNYLTDL